MSVFHFRQFSVLQLRSGMKVCTDATLFGAMMPVATGAQVLDIGSGTGLLSLMAAQMGASEVTGVELTTAAWEESCINCVNSPWNDHVHMERRDIREYVLSCDVLYDLIISNPPFFEDHCRATSQLRNVARHTDQLLHTELIHCASALLRTEGLFYVLVPLHSADVFISLAADSGLSLLQRVDIRGYARNSSKVCSMVFSDVPCACSRRLHTIYQGERQYSAESTYYLAPFLRRFIDERVPVPTTGMISA